jgi:hypothetical protein
VWPFIVWLPSMVFGAFLLVPLFVWHSTKRRNTVVLKYRSQCLYVD